MLHWLMQISVFLTTQGYSTHEQLLIGFVAGAMLVNPVAYIFIKSTGVFTRLISAPFEKRARRIREEKRKDLRITRLERHIDELTRNITNTVRLDDDFDLVLNVVDDESHFYKYSNIQDEKIKDNIPHKTLPCGIKF